MRHRLSPSGLYLSPMGELPGDVLTNVYKGFFPLGTLGEGQPMPEGAPIIVETFNIPLPLVWPNTDPPETFDPNKLLYLIWLNIIAYTDIADQPTVGPASMTARIVVDAPGGTTPIENVVEDEHQTMCDLAGTFLGRSSVHTLPDEGTAEVDILNYTSLAVFRPGSIPAWTNTATAWVAGQTRHIYVDVQSIVETGVLYLPNHRSNVVIAEFYGDVIETIGLSSVSYIPT